MKIEILNNIMANLPKYEIDIDGKNISLQEDTQIVENITVFDYDLYENKYINVEENGHIEDYIQTGEFVEGETYFEGAKILVQVNRYERDTKARSACIKKYGAVCSVCNMDFGKVYGERGQNFIEVHHLIPLHKIGKSYTVTADDLRPICSNCHSMIHRFRDDMTIEKLKSLFLLALTQQPATASKRLLE